jgi:hypothetical protein
LQRAADLAVADLNAAGGVLGRIGFDAKGDLTLQNLVWYVWRGGTYVPLEPSH